MWRKSSRSTGGECVEVAATSGQVYVRDSNTPTGAVLEFSGQQWGAFIHGPLIRKSTADTDAGAD
jgi:hypothetical protein